MLSKKRPAPSPATGGSAPGSCRSRKPATARRAQPEPGGNTPIIALRVDRGHTAVRVTTPRTPADPALPGPRDHPGGPGGPAACAAPNRSYSASPRSAPRRSVGGARATRSGRSASPYPRSIRWPPRGSGARSRIRCEAARPSVTHRPGPPGARRGMDGLRGHSPGAGTSAAGAASLTHPGTPRCGRRALISSVCEAVLPGGTGARPPRGGVVAYRSKEPTAPA